VKDGKPEKIDKTRKEASRLSREEWREYISTIWRFAPEKDRAHPAPYPLELPRRVIKLFSFVDDVILDPFMGSGTTAVAALETGRQFVGYEINPEYVSMAEQRIRNYRNETRQGDIFPEPTGGSQYPSTEVIHRLKNLNDSDYDAMQQMLDEGYSIEEILFRSNRK
jgi:hypothetical protein